MPKFRRKQYNYQEIYYPEDIRRYIERRKKQLPVTKLMKHRNEQDRRKK